MDIFTVYFQQLYLHIYQKLSVWLNKVILGITQCLLCGNHCHNSHSICHFCQTDLPNFTLKLTAYNLLQWPIVSRLFPKLKADQLICVAPYQWPFNFWISQLKYQKKTELNHLLSSLLVRHWQAYLQHENYHVSDETIVISVPLHIQKWQSRGFNQTHLLAKNFSTFFKYNYQPELIMRIKTTSSQVGLSGNNRKKNLQNAFELKKHVSLLARDIIIIDDVITTGATVNEICKLFRVKKVNNITILTLCIALPN